MLLHVKCRSFIGLGTVHLCEFVRLKLIGLMLMSIFAQQVKAQYALVGVPPPARFTLDDILNLTVTGPLVKEFPQFEIEVQVLSSEGQLKWSGHTGLFVFYGSSFSVSRMRLQEVGGLHQKWISLDFQQALSSHAGEFPVGSYLIRYVLHGYKQGVGYSYNLAESSVDAESGSVFPASLLYPLDGDSLSSSVFTFTWTPPMGTGKIRVSQEFLIVPILSGQTPEQALLANPAHFRQKDLIQPSLFYHGGYPPLMSNQWYAWQVRVFINGMPALTSEAWRFILPLQKPEPCEPKKAEVFYELSTQPPTYYIPVEQGQLDVQFTEKYAISEEFIQFEILNARGKKVADHRTLSKPHGVGFNRFSFLLSNQEVDLPIGFFTLVVYGEKNDRWFLKFHDKTSYNPCQR